MRAGPPELPGGAIAESPIDRALGLLLSGERDAALRWAGGAVQHDPAMPSGLMLCGRLLADAGRVEVAREALELCLAGSIDTGNLPLAVAACSDLRALGVEPRALYARVAAAFGKGSARLGQIAPAPPQLPAQDTVHPLASVLTGMALLSRVTEIVRNASQSRKALEASREKPPSITPLALFSDLPPDALEALIEVFEIQSVSKDAVIMEEGAEGAEAFILARGELEARRSSRGGEPVVLARLTAGALVGEMALLSRAPRVATVVACRPSILLMARKDALDEVAEQFANVGTILADYCRRRMVQNLFRTSPVLRAVIPEEQSYLLESLAVRHFEPGEVIIEQNVPANGIYLIASGEVSVVRQEHDDDPLVLASLGPGDLIGEVSVVLRKNSTARVVAHYPTLTLQLPRSKFLGVVKKHPSVLVELYQVAVQRDEETAGIVAEEAVDVDDSSLE